MQTKLITGTGCTDEFAASPSYVLIGLSANGIERIKHLAKTVVQMQDLGVDEIRSDATYGDIRVTWLSSVTAPNLQGAVILNDELKADLEANMLDDDGAADDFDIPDIRIRGTSICVDKSSFYVWAYDKDSRVQYEGKRIDFADVPELAELVAHTGTISRGQSFTGFISVDGVRVDVEFQAKMGATVAEKDAAFLAALAQQAEINYLQVGEVDLPDVKQSGNEVGAALATVLDMARDHVQDIESGIEEGIYDPSENTDLSKKQDALNTIEAYYLAIANCAPAELVQSVDVAYWDSQAYGSQMSEPDNGKQFVIDVSDQRETDGRFYVDVASKEGQVDDILSACVEINRLPGSRDDVACLHLHCADDLVVSFYKQGDQYVMRPESGVSVHDTMLPDGSLGWIVR